MYIDVRPEAAWHPRPGFGDPVPPRRPLKDSDVPVSSTTNATKGIARRVRDAIVKMSRSSDATLQNTAQRVVDGTVTLRFVGDLKPVANPDAVLLASGMSAADVATELQRNTLMEIPGSHPALVPKKGTVRAFERNGVVYIPTDSSEPNLSTDIIHEVNHVMNPIRASAATDRAAFLWESFTAEARASYVADYRGGDGPIEQGQHPAAAGEGPRACATAGGDTPVDDVAGMECGVRGARVDVDTGWQSRQSQVRHGGRVQAT